jgi:hypothetical protein
MATFACRCVLAESCFFKRMLILFDAAVNDLLFTTLATACKPDFGVKGSEDTRSKERPLNVIDRFPQAFRYP